MSGRPRIYVVVSLLLSRNSRFVGCAFTHCYLLFCIEGLQPLVSETVGEPLLSWLDMMDLITKAIEMYVKKRRIMMLPRNP
jgi:hypothetical protein